MHEHGWQSAHRAPEDRGDGGVGRVLGHGLHRAAGDLGGIEGLGVSAAQMGQTVPCRVEVAGGQHVGHDSSLMGEGLCPHDGPGGHGGGERSPARVMSGRDVDGQAGDGQRGESTNGEDGPAGHRVGVPPAFGTGDGVSVGSHRVMTLGIADDAVGDDPRSDSGSPAHQPQGGATMRFQRHVASLLGARSRVPVTFGPLPAGATLGA